jgi:hypothetical protein
MDAESKKNVTLILIGAGIGLVPTWINSALSSWISGISKKTAIIRKFKFALSTYLLEKEILGDKIPNPSQSYSTKYLEDTYEDFLSNAGLFNNQELFYFFWLDNLLLGTEQIREASFELLNRQPTWSKLLSNNPQKETDKAQTVIDTGTKATIKFTYEFLCFDESPYKRPFVYFWHIYKKRKLNTKAIDDFMKKK